MASCGTPALAWRQVSEHCSGPAQASPEKTHRWIACTVVPLLVLSLLAGCAPTIKFGSPPRTDRLKTLRVGDTSTADVLLALGEPRGHGRARFSIDLAPRTIWFYEYSQTDGRQIALKMLLVFFKQERYDGHLWFSSAALLDAIE